MDNKISWNTLQSQVEVFTEKLNSALNELGIYDTAQKLDIDHICVRLKDPSSVESLKQELQLAGDIISAVNVNGREIMIFELNSDIRLGKWSTKGLELPYPKLNHNYEDGWEHIEFVLVEAENSMEGVRTAFLNTFPNLDIQNLKDRYSYSEDEPHADGDQLPNPTIGLKVNGIGIKFHANPIQVVVGFE